MVGTAISALLVAEGWSVHGVSRSSEGLADVHEHVANLNDAADTARAPAHVQPEAMCSATWSRQATEAGNIGVNGAMVRNLVDGRRAGASVRDVALNRFATSDSFLESDQASYFTISMKVAE